MTKKKNKLKGLLIATTVAVLLPLSFYLLAKYLGKDQLQLPPYFLPLSDTLSAEGDTLYRQVPDIQLVNQTGDTLWLNRDLPGKILLVNFFFTSCNSICPRLTEHMKMLQHAYRKHAKMNSDMDTVLHFISISVDPNDSVSALRQYAVNHGVDQNRWWLCTGRRDEIYHLAREILKVKAAPANSGAEELMHTESFVLLDKERYIRGYYNGLDSIEIKRAADDIGWLGLEKKRK